MRGFHACWLMDRYYKIPLILECIVAVSNSESFAGLYIFKESIMRAIYDTKETGVNKQYF